MRLKVLALGGALLLAVAGCGGNGKAGAGGPPRTVVDPVPAVITVGYVNRVLAQLNVVYSDALRISLTTKQITPQVKTDLRAIYADPLYQEELKGFQLQLQHVPADLQHPLGVRVITVTRLITASPHCVFIVTRTDFSQLVTTPRQQPASEYYSLIRKDERDDPNHMNHTPWMFGFNEVSLVRRTIPNPCADK